jgi:hypothetical protein
LRFLLPVNGGAGRLFMSDMADGETCRMVAARCGLAEARGEAKTMASPAVKVKSRGVAV